MTDMSPAEVSARLREAANLADLRVGHRLDAKVDMSPEAVGRRLRLASHLRDVCRKLAADGVALRRAPGDGTSGPYDVG